MNERTNMDRVRDLYAGRLTEEEAARLRVEASEDPELAALMDAWDPVVAMTAYGVESPEGSATSFEDLLRRIAVEPSPVSRRWSLPRVAIAASVLIVAGLAFAVPWTESTTVEPVVSGPATVTLSAVPVRSPEIADAPAVPSALADWSPVADGKIRWLEDVQEAQRIAAATGRRVLLFIHHRHCPMCHDLDGRAFRMDEVLARIDEFVPVRVDVERDTELARPYLEDGAWPYLGTLDRDGDPVSEFGGVVDPKQVLAGLEAAEVVAAGGQTVPWKDAATWTRELVAAAIREDAGDWGGAWSAYDAVPEGAGGTFGPAGAAGRLRIAAAARASLLEARDSGPSRAPGRLVEAKSRFAGTPFAADLEAVRRVVEERGMFPRLVQAQK